MKGLRFYRSSVTSQVEEGTLLFNHSQIEEKRSDFDYIFRTIYNDFSGKFLTNDELPIFDINFEHKILDEFEKFIIQDNENYSVTKPEILEYCGKNIQEFEGGELLILNQVPKVMEWNDYCVYEENHKENIECYLHNWDGIYWEIFSSNESYFLSLLKTHNSDKNLEIYWVDFNLDYPTPQRNKNELTHA